jgi:hypothetical protein
VNSEASSALWNCVGHNPTEWSCGVASVRREPDGWWRWSTGGHNGRMPSRRMAMEQAEREYAQNVPVRRAVSASPPAAGSEQNHADFQKWHERTFGWPATSRSTEPGQSDHYEHPFTNGAWRTWRLLRPNDKAQFRSEAT